MRWSWFAKKGDPSETGHYPVDNANAEGGPANNVSDDTLRQSGERDLSETSQQAVASADGALHWPENPRMDILMPQIGGRAFLGNPDGDLHRGNEPERIDRIANMRIFGHAGPMEYGDDRSGEYLRIGHIPTPSQPVGRMSPIQSNATQDEVFIPAGRIGNPLS